MMGTNSEARKAREGQPLAVLREADRLERKAAVLRALQRVYGDATWLEGDALRDALEDEGLLS
jgi:hypothetical protein